MSLEQKVALGLLALNSLGCNGKNHAIELDGVTIYEAVTDSTGKATFKDEESDEPVTVDLTIQDTTFPVSDANILYFNHPDFKAFSIAHPAFAPQLQIALHNSNHAYSLTPAPLQILYNQPAPEKEQSKPGAEKFISWAEAGWQHTGCLNRENMLTLMKPGAYLIKKMGIVRTIGFSDDKFDKGVQYIEDNLSESTIAEVYVFIPSQHGFRGTTTITALDIKLGKCAENAANKENGKTGNTESSNCPGMLFCDEFSGSSLDKSKWNIINDPDISVGGGWLNLYNASSVATRNAFGNSCADKRIELQAKMSNAGFDFGQEISLYGLGTQVHLSCGNETRAASGINLSSNTSISLATSQNTLSFTVGGNSGSMPCAAKLQYLQLTAGFKDTASLDYVRVKCK